MKRTSSTIIEKTKRNSLLKIDNDNIESLKMLTGELDGEDLDLIRQKYNEKKELSEAANFVKDYVNELKEGMKDNYNEDNFEFLNSHMINQKYKKNIKSDMRLKPYIEKVFINEYKNDNNYNLFSKRSKHSKKSKKSKHSDNFSSDENYYNKRKTIANHNPNLLRLNIPGEENLGFTKKDSIVIRPNKTHKFSLFDDGNNFFDKKTTSRENLYGRKKSTSFLDNLFFEKKKVTIVFLKEEVVLFRIMIMKLIKV